MGVTDELTTHGDEFWLFGYGSLIWKPPPHFDKRIPGWVEGYVRRFWQARYTLTHHSLSCLMTSHPHSHQPSQDHRGTPTAPGRVVTLIERSYWSTLADAHDAPSRVWGVAYRIRPDKVAEVKDYLDIREINGYTIHHTPFHPAAAQQQPIRTLVYIGTPDNDQFTGPQDPDALAVHIRHSVGPSGLNTEYLFNLHEALEGLSPDSGDDHIRDLTERVRAIMAAEEAGQRPADAPPFSEAAPGFKQDHSTEEQEETEKA